MLEGSERNRINRITLSCGRRYQETYHARPPKQYAAKVLETFTAWVPVVEAIEGLFLDSFSCKIKHAMLEMINNSTNILAPQRLCCALNCCTSCTFCSCKRSMVSNLFLFLSIPCFFYLYISYKYIKRYM